MVKTLVDYLNVYLGTLGLRTEGIAQVRQLDGNRWPCLVGSGEDIAVNVEYPVIYHRILSGPTKSIDEDGSPRHDDPIATLTWSMRAVAVFDNIYCQDTEEKVIQNIFATLKLASTDAIAQSLLISQVSYTGNNSERGLSAWDAEFGIDYDYSRKIIYVDYEIEAGAFESCFTVQGCEDDINVIDVIIGEYCTESTPCADATVTLNGVEFGTVAAGGTLAGLVEYVNGTPVGSLVGAIWTIPNPATCEDVTITVNGSAYSTVAAGGYDNIPVVDGDGVAIGSLTPGGYVVIADSAITVNATPYSNLPATDALTIPVVNSAATQIGTVNAGTNVVIADSSITVNSSAYGSTPATVTGNVLVVDSSRVATGSLNGFGEWEIPACPSAALLSAELMKTNQTTSYRAGDDGDLEKGRPTDFFTLSVNNNFGNNKRFTGTTGGYQDAALNYFDAAGAGTTSALAFPNDVVLDWSTYNGSTVQGWYRLLRTAATWNNAIDNALTFTIGAFTSGWYLPNAMEALSIAVWEMATTFGQRYSYPPFNLASNNIWTSTTAATFNTTLAVYLPASTTIPVFTLAKTSPVQQLITRKFGVSGTTIT